MHEYNRIKYELQNLIKGEGGDWEKDNIEAANTYLRNCFAAGKTGKGKKPEKSGEERALIDFATSNQLFVSSDFENNYFNEGAEQKVYLDQNNRFVLKLADGIFYENWTDYLHNLILHNYFFSDTKYDLKGFYINEGKFFAVVTQPFVFATSETDLEKMKEQLLLNGFINKKNNDYFHPELGIILEDLHDENVLVNDNVFFFIDTVFYLTEEFFKP